MQPANDLRTETDSWEGETMLCLDNEEHDEQKKKG